MTDRRLSSLALTVTGMLVLSGCQAIEGIFKAGFWTGVIMVVIVVVGLVAVVSRLR